MARWEPELINAARTTGTNWATLAPALGVASRQAAERRFLRLQPSTTGESTAEGRVDAERDRRAADKAVAAWARRHATTLRQLAGQVSTLDDLGDTGGQASATALGAALGTNDPAELLKPLTATHHTSPDHTPESPTRSRRSPTKPTRYAATPSTPVAIRTTNDSEPRTQRPRPRAGRGSQCRRKVSPARESLSVPASTPDPACPRIAPPARSGGAAKG